MSDNHDKHHILSDKMAVSVLIGLLVLTVVTVAVTRVDFGPLNTVVAFLVATIKAALVILFFMGLKYDEVENKAYFYSSFIFLIIFVALTAADVFTRPAGWRNQGSHLKEVSTVSKFSKPWISSPELLAHGKAVYQAQCAVCHGPEGFGNGPAAAALNPVPRNFHEGEAWINGRKISEIFLTLKNGLNAMPSFATISTDDRWAVSHYVSSWGPKAPEASNDDLKKAGIVDPTKDDGGVGVGGSQKRLPISFAIERYLERASAAKQ